MILKREWMLGSIKCRVQGLGLGEYLPVSTIPGHSAYLHLGLSDPHLAKLSNHKQQAERMTFKKRPNF